jgi:mRNA interferase MazF
MAGARVTRAPAPAGAPSRFDVFLVDLEPTRGGEIKKRRPCVVVSPDEINHALSTAIVAPMTTGSHKYPWRVACRFKGTSGSIVLEQLRTVDRARFVRRLGRLDTKTAATVLDLLGELFAP